MTQDEIKALELEALIEDLRLNHEYCPKEVILQAADELERLQQLEQEPVAWISPSGALYRTRYHAVANAEQLLTPLFTHPPQRTWVGLTDEDMVELFEKYGHKTAALLDALEAKLKEKNTDAGLKTGVGKPGDFV